IRLGDGAAGADHPLHGDLAAHVGLPHELGLVAVLQLRVVRLDHAPDQLLVVADDHGLAAADLHVGGALASQAADAASIGAGAAATTLRADRADADGVAHAAAALARALEAEAAEAVRVTHRVAGNAADRALQVAA